jgi:hypothetical protein
MRFLRSLSTFAVVLSILLFAGGRAQGQSLQERLKSSDPQVRCDAFYELFDGGGEPSKKEHLEMLNGKSTAEIYDLLGKPTSIGVLEYKGIKWLLPNYVFEVCPTKAPNDAQEACKQGWRYGPSILFRNGISVPHSKFDRETGATRYSVPPEHLRFKRGGQFP